MPHNETKVSTVFVRQKKMLSPSVHAETVITPQRKLFQPDKLLKNLGVASALVLCAVTLRTGTVPALDPAADVILTAATDHSLLSDQLGKLSFVSALFPETVLVFGETSIPTLAKPIDGEQITHTWSEQEPYTAWKADRGVVTAATSGEVTGVYHGNGDERIVQVMDEDGLICRYGNLESVNVRTGDAVSTGDPIGTLLPDEEFVFEVRKNGVSVDPSAYLLR